MSAETKTKIIENDYELENFDFNTIFQMNFTIEKIYNIFRKDKIEILIFLASIKLIKNKMICIDCKNYMKLNLDSKSLDGYIWICNNQHKKLQISVRKFSFFNNIRKSFKQCFLFIYYWCEQKEQIKIINELSISKNTCSSWCFNLRELCQIILTNSSNFQLGGIDIDGSPKIVEIDESLFFRRKYNVGRCRSSGWVFGMIERGTKKCMLIPVPNRSRQTLEPLIRKWILPGTHIISDKWGAYSFLAEDISYQYSSINHSLNFVDHDNSIVHTQSIECTWLHAKKSLRKIFGTTETLLQGYLYEFIFRYSISDKAKTFNEMLIIIIRVNDKFNID